MNIKSIVLFVFIAAFTTACTDKAYTYRKKVKVKPNEIAAEKRRTSQHATEKNLKQSTAIAPETETAQMMEAVITAGTETTPVIKTEPSIQLNLNKSSAVKENLTTSSPKNTDKATIKEFRKELKKEIKAKQNIPGLDSTVKKLLIAGLIFLLAAIILSVISGLAGSLASAIGGVLIIVALIVWLLNIL